MTQTHRPLDAAEVADVCAALDELLSGALVRDAVLIDGRDDLLLFLERGDSRHALHLAPGGRRARLTTTRRRFARRSFATGPRPDRVAELLRDRRLTGCAARAGDRAASFLFLADDASALRIELELFGARGLWALVAATADESLDGPATGSILALSRLPGAETDRPLRPGQPWQSPPVATTPSAAAGNPTSANTPRFAAPMLERVDRYFTAVDQHEEAHGELANMRRVLERQRKKLDSRLRGAEAQREAAARSADLRRDADMLLAYASTLAPGAAQLRCPDPSDPDRELVIDRDPRLPAHAQAEQLYRTARKHEDGAATAARRIDELTTARATADRQIARIADLDAADPAEPSTREGVEALHDELARNGLLEPRRPPKADPKKQRIKKITGGENFRRFRSAEGLMILVGRDNKQNDKLVTRVARGSDVWLHVGRGYAGSHVLIRVDKGKTASLESLLDGGTLAIHFSKVRGAEQEEVIYCPAKSVRKPKGLPPGKVVPGATRALQVRREPDRLERLLSSADGDATL